MSAQKRPSPDRQNVLYSSHLKGMERSVPSFKSFIRAAPPRASPYRPLPPPSRPQPRKDPSASSVTSVQTRSTIFSLWEAPSNWDNNEESQAQSPPLFATRHYSPILPEPPEDIAAMQMDPALWQQGYGAFPQTPLDLIQERTTDTPDIPPRNPSRLSLVLSKPASIRKGSKDTLPSISSRHSAGTTTEETFEDAFESASRALSKPDSLSPLDFASALSDMTMKEKAFASPSLGSPRDQGIVWGGPNQRWDSLQMDGDAYLDLEGNKLTFFRKGGFPADDSPVSPEWSDFSDEMQALSFAQDYHNVLADQNFNGNDQLESDTIPKTPPKDRDLTPRPLAWTKESESLLPVEAFQRPPMPNATSSGQRQNLRKMSSWVSNHLRRDQQTGLQQRSTSTPEAAEQANNPESEVDQHSKKDVSLTNIIRHGKDFVIRKVQRSKSEPEKCVVITHPLPQYSAQAPENASVSAAPFELATPLFRLPGGLAIVRQSPLSTPRPQTASSPPSSPSPDLPWPSFPASPPPLQGLPRTGSWPDLSSVKEKLRTPFAPPFSLRSFSLSTSSLATPDPSCPYSPPQPRRRSHNVGSPLAAPPHSLTGEQPSVDCGGGAPHKLSLFERAKSARDAWRRQHREVKNERLKQSIRLVGPADARGVAGYIACGGKEGRVSGDSGVGEGGSETS